MVEVMKIMAISFKRCHAHTAALSASDPEAATINPCLHWRLLDTAPFSWVLVCTRFCLCLPRVSFPSPE